MTVARGPEALPRTETTADPAIRDTAEQLIDTDQDDEERSS